jgi:hypothetical protein
MLLEMEKLDSLFPGCEPKKSSDLNGRRRKRVYPRKNHPAKARHRRFVLKTILKQVFRLIEPFFGLPT